MATQSLNDRKLEDSVKSFFAFEYRQKFGKTPTSRKLWIATGALFVAGVALVLAPPLLYGGLVAGVSAAFSTMAAGLGLMTVGAGFSVADDVLTGKATRRELDKDFKNGTLLERYKNEHIAKVAESIDLEGEGYSLKATEAKSRAEKLRTEFGIEASAEKPAAPAVAQQVAAITPPTAR